jgi:hypothetical protein
MNDQEEPVTAARREGTIAEAVDLEPGGMSPLHGPSRPTHASCGLPAHAALSVEPERSRTQQARELS